MSVGIEVIHWHGFHVTETGLLHDKLWPRSHVVTDVFINCKYLDLPLIEFRFYIIVDAHCAITRLAIPFGYRPYSHSALQQGLDPFYRGGHYVGSSCSHERSKKIISA
jgi:hypothetical protein